MKKLIFIILLLLILLGGGFVAVTYLRSDDAPPTPPSSPTAVIPPASSAQSSSVDVYFRVGASLVKTLPTAKAEERIRRLRLYQTLSPDLREKVKSGLARNLVSVTQAERSEFNQKILEGYLALPEQERKDAKATFMDLFAGLPDTVVSDPPLTTTPLVRGTLASVSAAQVTGDVLLSIDPANGINLRLENFRISTAPDLHVYLTKNKAPKTSADIGKEFIDLGALKGNAGSQNYVIPADTPVQEFSTVVLFSAGFDTVYAVATTQ